MVAATVAVSSCASGEAARPEPSQGPRTVLASSPTRLERAIRAMRPKPVVINYWATWCDPCKKEMPHIVAAAHRYRRWVGFIGVNVEDDRAAAQRFANRYRIPFISHALTKAEVQSSRHILGLPVTQFYRADGELAFDHQGEISASELKEKIEELIHVGKPADAP